MSQVRVIVVSPEEASDGTAEFWCGAELMGVTILSEGGLQLRIDSRADRQPRLITRPASRTASPKRTD
jgi:hypothetical protein